MNPRGGWALIRRTWASWLQYRSFFFLLAFGWMLPPLISLFVWTSAAGDGNLGGYSRGEFSAYYLVLILVNQITYSQTNWVVGDIIRDGGLSAWLLRPMSPLFQVLSAEIAGKVVYLIFVIPAALFLSLLLRPELHTSPERVLLFMAALFLAWALRFFWGYWLALLAFWATRANALLALQDTLVFLFAGIVAPVPLLPGFLQEAAHLLPFRYMVGFPVEVLSGQATLPDLFEGFMIQSAWLALALLLSLGAWKLGLRRYSAVGG